HRPEPGAGTRLEGLAIHRLRSHCSRRPFGPSALCPERHGTVPCCSGGAFMNWIRENLDWLIFLAGFGQLAVLIASALVPVRLKWTKSFQALPRLHRQLFWIYGGYIVLAIVAFGLLSLLHSGELAGGGGLARALCAYIAVFWGIRLALQM